MENYPYYPFLSGALILGCRRVVQCHRYLTLVKRKRCICPSQMIACPWFGIQYPEVIDFDEIIQ